MRLSTVSTASRALTERSIDDLSLGTGDASLEHDRLGAKGEAHPVVDTQARLAADQLLDLADRAAGCGLHRRRWRPLR